MALKTFDVGDDVDIIQHCFPVAFCQFVSVYHFIWTYYYSHRIMNFLTWRGYVSVSLLSYKKIEIPHYDTVVIPCQFKDFEYKLIIFYVADVGGAAIAGLPTCELLEIITVNCAIQEQARKSDKINSAKDPKAVEK